MLPALPTGMQWTSGASPSWSTTSNAPDFCPSIRYGLTEFTTVTGAFSPRSRTMSSAWSKFPRSCSTFAPWMRAWANLPSAMCPSGIRTAQVRPARALKAAADAEVFPVEAQTTALAPSSTALEMAIVIPRSLNDPVGLAPSILSITRAPTRADSRGASKRGVPPSSNEMTGVSAVTGRNSRYSSMTPRHDKARWPSGSPAVMPRPRSASRLRFAPRHQVLPTCPASPAQLLRGPHG